VHVFRKSSALRFAVTLVMALGWLLVSNHCALATFGKGVATPNAHQCCQSGHPIDHSAPSPQPELTCCKALHVVLPAGASAGLRHASPVSFEHVVAVLTWSDDRQSVCLFRIDSGPPQALAFAELVLHRSLLAHAPPSIV
jgi:hypothetical protein